MDEAVIVRCGQPRGDFTADLYDLREAQRRTRAQAVLQRLSFQERHGNERDAAIFIDLIDRDDVIVLNGRRRARFAEETLTRVLSLSNVGKNYLEGHGASQAQILGDKDRSHAAASEQLQDAIRAKTTDFLRRLRGMNAP